MAKRKKAEAKEAKFVLPKQLAGVKIPRALREQGHHLAALAQHPLVKEIVAAGLVAIAAAVRERSVVAKAKKTAGEAVDAVATAATEAFVDTATAPAAKPAPKARAAKPAAAPRAAAKPAAKKPAASKAPAKAAAKPAAKPTAKKPAAKAAAAKPAGSLPPPPPRTPRTRRTSPSKTTH